MTLTVREHMALQIEDTHWPRLAIGRKDAACHAIGLTPVRHAQIVMQLIDRGDAVAAYPVLTSRLRRLRNLRAGVRRSQP